MSIFARIVVFPSLEGEKNPGNADTATIRPFCTVITKQNFKMNDGGFKMWTFQSLRTVELHVGTTPPYLRAQLNSTWRSWSAKRAETAGYEFPCEKNCFRHESNLPIS